MKTFILMIKPMQAIFLFLHKADLKSSLDI